MIVVFNDYWHILNFSMLFTACFAEWILIHWWNLSVFSEWLSYGQWYHISNFYIEWLSNFIRILEEYSSNYPSHSFMKSRSYDPIFYVDYGLQIDCLFHRTDSAHAYGHRGTDHWKQTRLLQYLILFRPHQINFLHFRLFGPNKWVRESGLKNFFNIISI